MGDDRVNSEKMPSESRQTLALLTRILGMCRYAEHRSSHKLAVKMAGGGVAKPLGPPPKALFYSLLVVLIAFIPSMLEFAFRIRYPTLRYGVVLVTGASKGIGRDAVDALVEDGYVVFAGVRKQEDMAAFEALENPSIKPVMLDVTNQGSIDSALQTVAAQCKALDKPFAALVNNAGFGPSSTIEFHDLDNARSIFETNVFGVLAVTQKFLPLLREHHGRVIMVSSLLGKMAIPGLGVYSSSKHALEGISDSLRQELKPFQVSVSVVEPGVVKTPFHDLSHSTGMEMVSDEAKEVYSHIYKPEANEYRARMLERGAPASEVSAAIVHATSSTHPKTRYVVANLDGVPGWVLLTMAWALPDRMRDLLF